jgi:hypothetical protein
MLGRIERFFHPVSEADSCVSWEIVTSAGAAVNPRDISSFATGL